MKTTKQRTRLRIPIPADFPAALLEGLPELVGSAVLCASSGKQIAKVENAALETSADGAALQVGLFAPIGYDLRLEDGAFRMELERVGEAPADPGEQRKWKISAISRSPK